MPPGTDGPSPIRVTGAATVTVAVMRPPATGEPSVGIPTRTRVIPPAPTSGSSILTLATLYLTICSGRAPLNGATSTTPGSISTTLPTTTTSAFVGRPGPATTVW